MSNLTMSELREDFLRDQQHEASMRTDTEYFTEYILDNTRLYCNAQNAVFLTSMLDMLQKTCAKYNQSYTELLDSFKEY